MIHSGTGTLAILPEREEAEEDTTRRTTGRRWLIVLAVVLGVLAVALVVALWIAEAVLESRLSKALGTPVEIDDMDLRWDDLALSAHDIRAEDSERFAIVIPRVDATLKWSDLRHGMVSPRIVLMQPHFTVHLTEDLRGDQPPPERIEGFESIEIIDGTVSVKIPAGPEEVDLEISGIDATLAFWEPDEPTSKRDLELHVQAALGKTGWMEIKGWLSSKTPKEDWTMTVAVRRFDLVALNPLWRQVLHMDLEQGFFALEAELSRTPLMLRGKIRPHFEDMEMLGPNEHPEHPMAEVLFGQMLEGAESDIDISRPVQQQGGMGKADPLHDDWREIVKSVIRQGYERRLSGFEGFEGHIGDLSVDFRDGLLQMYDVQLRNRNPRVDRPMFSVQRIDVKFDEEIIEPGRLAHKQVTLWSPRMNVVIGVEGHDSVLKLDSSFLDQLSAVPYQTSSLEVHDGRIDVWAHRNGESAHAFVDGIEVSGRHLAADTVPMGTRGAELSASGWVFGQTEARLNVVFEPKSPVPNLDANLLVEPIPLRPLSPLLRAYGNVGVQSGSLGFVADLSAHGYLVEASVMPTVEGITLLPANDKVFRKIIIQAAAQRLGYETIQMRYEMDPNHGLFHQFFPELVDAAFGAG